VTSGLAFRHSKSNSIYGLGSQFSGFYSSTRSWRSPMVLARAAGRTFLGNAAGKSDYAEALARHVPYANFA
jgi:hypothetical protein